MPKLDASINELTIKKKQLLTTKRQLRSKGFDDFVEEENTELLREARKVNTQIAQINTQIKLLKQKDVIVLHGNKKESNMDTIITKDYAYSTSAGRKS